MSPLLLLRCTILLVFAGFFALAEVHAVMFNRDTGDQLSRDLAQLPPFGSQARLGGCSAVLIAPDVVLSAAHCTGYAPTGRTTVTWNGQSRDGTFWMRGDDLLVAVLDNPFNGAVVTAPYSGNSELDSLAWKVGQGGHGIIGSGDYGLFFDGIFRAMTNRIEVDNVPNPPDPVTFNWIFYDFDGPPTDPTGGRVTTRYEGGTAPGDSGGPLYMYENGRWWVIALTSGPDAGFYRDARVSTQMTFIEEISGYRWAQPVVPALKMRWVAQDLVPSTAHGQQVSSWPRRDGAEAWSSNGQIGAIGTVALSHGATPSGRAAVSFGGNARLALPQEANPVAGETAITVALVLRANAAGAGADGNWTQNAGIIDGDLPGVANDWGLALSSSGRINWGIGRPDTTATSPGGSVGDGDWRVVVATWDGAEVAGDAAGTDRNMILYLDTAENRVLAHGAKFINVGRDASTLTLGGSRAANRFFQGEIAEVRVYRGALDEEAAGSLLRELRNEYIEPQRELVLTRPVGGTLGTYLGQQLWIEGNAVAMESLSWEQLAGPAPALFSSPSTASTGISFPETGIYNLNLTASGGGQTFSKDLTVQVYPDLPVDSQGSNIGGALPVGSFTKNNGEYLLRAGGQDVWGTSDSFYFVHRQVEGDAALTARVVSLANSHPWAKAGVMIRSNLAAGAANAFVAVTPGNGVTSQARLMSGEGSVYSATGGLSAPYWVRIERRGQTITTFRSTDGLSWVQQGPEREFGLGASALFGLGYSSQTQGTAHEAVFDNVRLERLTPMSAQSVTGSWIGRNLGETGVAGSETIQESAISITGGGSGFREISDSLRFVYQPLEGDGSITARVAGFPNAGPDAFGGVMLRTGLRREAAHAAATVRVGGGVSFARRAEDGAYTDIDRYSLAAPYWVRVRRVGNTFTSFHSEDGVNWVQQGAAGQVAAMPADALWGLAVTSHFDNVLGRAVFDNVQLEPLGSSPVSNSWTGGDVGSVDPAGTHSIGGGNYTVQGSGADIFGTADGFYFLSQNYTGDAQLTARVVSHLVTHPWTKAGVMVRANRTAGAPNAFLATTGVNGIAWQTRSTAGGATAGNNSGTTNFGSPRWVRLVRTGNSIACFQSENGVDWKLIASPQSFPGLPTTLLAGFAVSSASDGATSTTTFDNVLLQESGGAPTAPVVRLPAFQNPSLSDSFRLRGEVVGPPGTSVTWSRIAGPGSLAFEDASHLSPRIAYAPAGSYTIRLLADNGSVATYVDRDFDFSLIADWNFAQDGNAEGWMPGGGTGAVTVSGGLLSAPVTGGDPQLFNNDSIYISGDLARHVLVRFRSNVGGTAQLFWGHSGAIGYAGTRVVNYNYTTPGEWATAVFDPSAHSQWTGEVIRSLRFDPPGEAGADFEVDWIALIETAGEEPPPSPPTLSAIGDQTIFVNTGTGALSFTVGSQTVDAGTLTLSGSSSNTSLVPNSNIVFGGGGSDRTITLTPAAGQMGGVTITVTVSDGNQTTSTTFVVNVISDTDPIAFDFEDGTLSGWTDVSTDSQGRQLFAVVPPSLNSPNTTPHLGGHFIGLHIPAFDLNAGYTQDSAHDTLILRSPAFTLSGIGDLTAWLSGGGSGSLSLVGTSVASLPSASSTGGFLGVALRNVTTGTFVLSASKSVGGSEWEQMIFTEAELGALPQGDVYTFDLIDARHGGWGWVNMDSVTIPGWPPGAEPPPSPPTLSAIGDQTIFVNTGTGALSLTVGSQKVDAGTLTLLGSSSNTSLVPNGNIVFGGDGSARTITVTPTAGQTGDVTITVTVSDGDQTTSTTFVVNVVSDTDPIAFDFEDGTMGDWTVTSTDSQVRQLFAVVPPSVSSPNMTPHSGGHFIGLHIPAFDLDAGYTQDSAHDTLIFRSPAFTLNGEGDLTAWLLGGGSAAVSLAGTSVASLPSLSSADGFLGVALRNVTTGTFVLSASKSDGGGEWEQVTFAEAELAGLPQGDVYTLDLIDARHGGWGWVNIDSVTIPGTLSEPLPDLPKLTIQGWGESQVRISWPAAAVGWTLQSSAALDGDYSDAGLEITVENTENAAYDTVISPRRFYRLSSTLN